MSIPVPPTPPFYFPPADVPGSGAGEGQGAQDFDAAQRGQAGYQPAPQMPPPPPPSQQHANDPRSDKIDRSFCAFSDQLDQNISLLGASGINLSRVQNSLEAHANRFQKQILSNFAQKYKVKHLLKTTIQDLRENVVAISQNPSSEKDNNQKIQNIMMTSYERIQNLLQSDPGFHQPLNQNQSHFQNYGPNYQTPYNPSMGPGYNPYFSSPYQSSPFGYNDYVYSQPFYPHMSYAGMGGLEAGMLGFGAGALGGLALGGLMGGFAGYDMYGYGDAAMGPGPGWW